MTALPGQALLPLLPPYLTRDEVETVYRGPKRQRRLLLWLLEHLEGTESVIVQRATLTSANAAEVPLLARAGWLRVYDLPHGRGWRVERGERMRRGGT